MGRFNPSNIQANFQVFPKDDYLLTFTGVKSFLTKNGDEIKNFGVRYNFVIADGVYAGKKGIYTCYLHNDGSQAMTKQFFMGIFGYGKGEEEEKRFDVDTIDWDWNTDEENGTVGEAFSQLDGKTVAVSLDVGKNQVSGEPQQKFSNWRPMDKK